MKDPKPRKDGTCVVCKQKRVPPKNYTYRAEWKLDPFCSAVCARQWFGVDDKIRAA